MRVNEEEGVAAAVTSATPALSPPPAASSGLQRLVVGYALTKKKVKSFLQPKLLALAR
jgi:inositol-1,3,4-trisphosphate 5/6-kinase/inositol-tetrakisphosphate 1-kinase